MAVWPEMAVAPNNCKFMAVRLPRYILNIMLCTNSYGNQLSPLIPRLPAAAVGKPEGPDLPGMTPSTSTASVLPAMASQMMEVGSLYDFT